MRFFCAQHGCTFVLADTRIAAKLAEDGVTVLEPERVVPAASPADCLQCGNPFIPHPEPTTLGLDLQTGAPLAESADPAR